MASGRKTRKNFFEAYSQLLCFATHFEKISSEFTTLILLYVNKNVEEISRCHICSVRCQMSKNEMSNVI